MRRFGGRRRQCSVCRRTWRGWQRRRGTKPFRPVTKLLLQYLDNDNGPMIKQARRRKVKPATLRARVRKALDRFITQVNWSEPPKGPLIAIADAMIQRVKKDFYTFHFVLLRSVDAKRAVIMEPTLSLGTETWLGWQKSFLKIPNSSRNRIEAPVCDGHVGLVSLARENGWRLQRCHFHTRFRIANYVSSGSSSRHRKEGIQIHKLVEWRLSLLWAVHSLPAT